MESILLLQDFGLSYNYGIGNEDAMTTLQED